MKTHPPANQRLVSPDLYFVQSQRRVRAHEARAVSGFSLLIGKQRPFRLNRHRIMFRTLPVHHAEGERTRFIYLDVTKTGTAARQARTWPAPDSFRIDRAERSGPHRPPE
jgi:hypothetical protein